MKVLEKSLAWAALALAAVLLAMTGCRPNTSQISDAQVDVVLDPSPPEVGTSNLSLTLADASGKPLEGANVRVEGNMNHAGMKPSFADLSEVKPGQYEGTLEFTMGGDWFLLVNARLPDGRTVEHKVDVPGVRTK